ncbi:MAG: hypothetical protein FWH22_01970 [Fibromonadales bacterium]|nr:hypothetical protein [Fibromonadales bacterium]
MRVESENKEIMAEKSYNFAVNIGFNNSQLSTLNSSLLLIVALLLTSCSDYEREGFRMKAGEKYALKKWPDSAYIDTLDRFFANESVRYHERQKAEITMSMRSDVKRHGKAADVPAKKSQRQAAPRASEENQSTESFSERFFLALHKLSENPNNREYGRKYNARAGESLDDLLLRIYGAQSRRIPKHVSESMIRQLNPGLDIASFAEGDMVLLPLAANI